MERVGEEMQQDYHKICIQPFPSRSHNGVNIHVVAVQKDFIPQLPMGTQENPVELRDGKSGCWEKSSIFQKITVGSFS